MIDFHSHVLPRIDDGSRSVKESLSMLQLSFAQGVDIMAATPHFYPSEHSIEGFLEKREKSWQSLQPQLSWQTPRILLGAEVYFYTGMSRTSQLLQLTIQDTGLLMIEMPFSEWNDRFVDEVIEVNRRPDIQVVLAHVERYQKYAKPAMWKKLLQHKILMQANASFFTGRFSRYQALHMVQNGRIHLLGSDCHNMQTRRPCLQQATDFLAKEGCLRDIAFRSRALIDREEVRI